MTTIEELNARWEPWFMANNDTAEVWTRMKAKGVVAGWEAPIVLQPGVSISHTDDGVTTEADESEFFVFAVRLGREDLSYFERGFMTFEATVTMGIIEAAKAMELQGIDVGYPM